MTNVNEILRDHVTLTVVCMDRLYLNGYIANMQMPGQSVYFLTKHRGNKIPSQPCWARLGISNGHEWAEQLPMPVTAEDRQAGYAHWHSV